MDHFLPVVDNSATYFCKLADACAPVGWFLLAYRQCGLRKHIACQLNHLSASTIASIRGEHVHHLVSARILRCLRFTFQITRESARLAIRRRRLRLPEQDFHLKINATFHSARVNGTKTYANAH